MLKKNRVIIDDTLIQYHIKDSGPLVVTFAPAGKVLTMNSVNNGSKPWGFDFLSSQGINVISFNTIDNDHKYDNPLLKEWIKLQCFELHSERVGYAVSKGALGLSIFDDIANIDRAILFSPTLYGNTCNIKNITAIYDPFCIDDSQTVKKMSPTNSYRVHGVGHKVIECLQEIGILKNTVLSYINHGVIYENFNIDIKKRKTTERYYSYLKRNPTGKNTTYRKKVILKYWMNWLIYNPGKIVKKNKLKLVKSMQRKYLKYIN